MTRPDRRDAHDRPQTRGEEIANSLTHGVGLAASVAAAPILILTAARSDDAWRVFAASLFVATLIFLYAASTIYHAIPGSGEARAKVICRRVDHAAIYLLIAGTYTPVALVTLRGPWGWSLLGVIWGLAVVGVVLKSVFGVARLGAFSTAVYLAMGWLAVVAIRPLLANLELGALLWLLGGGIAYSAGVAFYVWERQRYSHAIWHLFVLGGSACHAWAVLAYVLPGA
jgi:hemolysin III